MHTQKVSASQSQRKLMVMIDIILPAAIYCTICLCWVQLFSCVFYAFWRHFFTSNQFKKTNHFSKLDPKSFFRWASRGHNHELIISVSNPSEQTVNQLNATQCLYISAYIFKCIHIILSDLLDFCQYGAWIALNAHLFFLLKNPRFSSIFGPSAGTRVQNPLTTLYEINKPAPSDWCKCACHLSMNSTVLAPNFDTPQAQKRRFMENKTKKRRLPSSGTTPNRRGRCPQEPQGSTSFHGRWRVISK